MYTYLQLLTKWKMIRNNEGKAVTFARYLVAELSQQYQIGISSEKQDLIEELLEALSNGSSEKSNSQ